MLNTEDILLLSFTRNSFVQWLVCAPELLLSISQGVCSGIIRGAGLQYVGAAISCISLYVFGAPIGMGLIFGAHYGIEGEITIFSLKQLSI